MKTKHTLILLVLAAAAFAYVWFVENKRPTSDEARENAGIVSEFERNDIDAITIRNATGTIELRLREGHWFMDAPVKDRADELAVAQLFTTCEKLRSETSLGDTKENRDKWKEWGVAKGYTTVKFSGGKVLQEIIVGKDTVYDGRNYARAEGSKVVHVIRNTLKNDLGKSTDFYRDKRLADLTAAQVSKLVIKSAKGEFELEKKGSHWSLVRPLKARADDQKITDLIANATTARIEEFVSEAKDPGAFGLTEPRATLTFTAEGVREPVVLQIGAAKLVKKEGDESKKPAATPAFSHVYVKLSTRDGVVTVPATIESLISIQPNDLRDQSLMRVQSDMVDRITIEVPGKEKLVLARNGESWVRKLDGKSDAPVNSGAANKLLNDLVSTKVARFVADMTSELKGFGLDQPQATVTLSSYSTEGTPETKPGDKPIVKVLLGKFEGDAGYAKLDDEPFIVAVPKVVLDGVWTDPLQWQDLKVLDLKKEDVGELEITRTGQPSLNLVFEKEKGWKLAKGDSVVNQNAAQSLVNTLTSLRAVRWMGATDVVKHGFEKPNLIVSYTLADKKTGRITIGGNTAEELWLTTIEGRPGTFLMCKPDFDALNAALIETPKPAASIPKPGEGTVTALPASASPPPTTIEPSKVTEPPKPTEVLSKGTKPASESAPKP